jgi:hypothetical protein
MNESVSIANICYQTIAGGSQQDCAWHSAEVAEGSPLDSFSQPIDFLFCG